LGQFSNFSATKANYKEPRPPKMFVDAGKGVGRKFSRGEGQRKKIPKINKKYRKIALFCLFQEGNGKNTEK